MGYVVEGRGRNYYIHGEGSEDLVCFRVSTPRLSSRPTDSSRRSSRCVRWKMKSLWTRSTRSGHDTGRPAPVRVQSWSLRSPHRRDMSCHRQRLVCRVCSTVMVSVRTVSHGPGRHLHFHFHFHLQLATPYDDQSRSHQRMHPSGCFSTDSN